MVGGSSDTDASSLSRSAQPNGSRAFSLSAKPMTSSGLYRQPTSLPYEQLDVICTVRYRVMPIGDKDRLVGRLSLRCSG
jgi:hypothetical protein